VYVVQRGVSHDLRATAPLLGRADATRLDLIWAAVQSDLSAPRRPVFPTDWHGSLRYGAAVLALLLALTVPMAISGGQLTLALPIPPTPSSGEATETAPLLPATLPTAVAVVNYGVMLDAARPTLPPAPRYAPTTAATDVP